MPGARIAYPRRGGHTLGGRASGKGRPFDTVYPAASCLSGLRRDRDSRLRVGWARACARRLLRACKLEPIRAARDGGGRRTLVRPTDPPTARLRGLRPGPARKS